MKIYHGVVYYKGVEYANTYEALRANWPGREQIRRLREARL